MPESLNTRKKLLKTLQLTDYATLIEDLNFNFSVLLSSPLFVGLQGEAGQDGTQGPAGIRGSKWMYASLDAFREQWPNDNLQGEYQITLDYLNRKLLSDEDRNKLLIATAAGDMFVDGDTFVANSKIYVLDLSNNRFVDTNQTINNSSDAYQENLQRYIQQVVNDILTNNPVYMGLVQTIDFQYAQAKNYTDSSANVNNKINENSMLDVKSTTSKDGAEIDTHKMFLPSGNVFDDEDNLTYVVGGAEAYHKIIQGTLAFNENDPVSNTVAKFGPTYGNPPSLVLLQNVQTNGVMIGYKKATKFTEFAKFWVNSNGGFVISSPNISDHYLKFSDIQLYHDRIEFNSDNFIFNGDVTFKKLSFKEISTTNFSVSEKRVDIGETFTETHIKGNKIFFDGINQNQFAAINAERKLSASPYSIDDTTNPAEITASVLKMPNMSLIKNLYDLINETNTSLTATRESVQNVKNSVAVSQEYLERRIATQNLTSGLITGQVIELCIKNVNSETFEVVKAKMFTAENVGRSSVTYSIGTEEVKADLSSFRLCDGNNDTPKLMQYTDDSNESWYLLKLMYIK